MSDAADTLRAKMAEHGITVDAVFVPFSQSRNAKPNPKVGQLSLNWRITLRHRDRIVYSTDYSAGCGHCPSYTQSMHSRCSVNEFTALVYECEHGRRARILPGGRIESADRAMLRPDMASVMSSLLMDADAIDYARYEDWARELGYDEDSRKGEQTYRVCLECALALRAAFGDALLQELRELAWEL
jgi:hypothetical protein